MLKVQEYLANNSLQKLQEEHNIEVRDYPVENLVVLNYDMIECDKNDPIVQECRALILEKNTWKVVARSFDRFLNAGEDSNSKVFPVSKSRIEEKIDGSITSVYFFNN